MERQPVRVTYGTGEGVSLVPYAEDVDRLAIELEMLRAPVIRPTCTQRRRQRRKARGDSLQKQQEIEIPAKRPVESRRKGDNPSMRRVVSPYAPLPKFTQWVQSWESVRDEVETEAARRRFAWNQLLRAAATGDAAAIVVLELRRFAVALDHLRSTIEQFQKAKKTG